jgi:hypothetical protein
MSSDETPPVSNGLPMDIQSLMVSAPTPYAFKAIVDLSVGGGLQPEGNDCHP